MLVSRTRVFGIAMMLYALLSTGFIVFNPSTQDVAFNVNTYIALGGLLIFVCGAVIAFKLNFDKMYAIGIYSISFGIYKILKSVSVISIDYKNFDILNLRIIDIISIISILLALSLIVLGASFIAGKSKKIWSKVGLTVIFLIIDFAYLKEFWGRGEWLLVATMFVEVVMLVMFISLLLSKDVRINTEEEKKKWGRNIFRNAKKQADRDYKEAKKEAEEERKEGNEAKADAIMEEAKKEKAQTIAEGKKVAKNAEKVRYVYNPETKTVEVMDEKNKP